MSRSRSAPGALGIPDLSAIIEQTKEQEKATEDDHHRLKELATIQEALLAKERQTLLDIARAASELREVEKARAGLKGKLATQKTALLVGASDIALLSAEIEKVLSSDGEPGTPGVAGAAALKAVEAIWGLLYGVTNDCLESQEMVAAAGTMSDAVTAIVGVLDEAVTKGDVIEKPEDTIRRQGLVLGAMAPAPDDD